MLIGGLRSDVVSDLGRRYWGSLTLGRLLGVVLTAKLSVHQLITLDFVLACIGAVMLLAVSASSLQGVYVAVAVMGVGFSTLYNDFDIIWDHFSRTSQLHRTPKTLIRDVCYALDFVPMLIGC